MKKIKMITYSTAAIAAVTALAINSTPVYSNSFTNSIKSFFKVDEKESDAKGEQAKQQAPSQSAPVNAPVAQESEREEAPASPVTRASEANILGEEQIAKKLVEEPNNVNYHFELGQLKLLKGDVDGARTTFSQLSQIADGSKLSLIGSVLVDLFLGETNEAYKKMSQSSLSSDPEILTLSSWCMFLGGSARAAETIIANASKVTNSRVALGTLATYYAATGNYDLAQTTLATLSQSGFIPAQGLVAKFLINSRFGENKDAFSDTFSELRNKFQLPEPVVRLIIANGYMLELNYPKAADQYREIGPGASATLAAGAKRVLARIENTVDPLLLNYHRSLTALAIKRKSTELMSRSLSASPRAVLKLIASIEERSEEALVESEFERFVVRGLGAKWYREKIVSLVSESDYSTAISKKLIAKESVDKSIWRPWDYFSKIQLEEDKKFSDEEIFKIIDDISGSMPSEMRGYIKLELLLDLYLRSLISKGDISKANEYYQSTDAFKKFLFSKVSKEELQKYLPFTQEDFELRLKKKIGKIARIISDSKQFSSYLSSQRDSVAVMDQLRQNPSLTDEQAKKMVGELSEGNCAKAAIDYYLSKRFKGKDTSIKYQGYLTCIANESNDAKLVDRSAGIFVETLFNAQEYQPLIKFYRENESWISRSNGYASVHYIDALGRSSGVDEARAEAKRVCANIEAEFCMKINSEIMPELEKRRLLVGISKASELINQAQAAISKKQYASAFSLLVEARKQDPLNPFIYMHFESLYRIDAKFDFLTQYTELITSYLTSPNLDGGKKTQLMERIFKPCEDVNLPCETLVTVVRDGRFNDVAEEVLKPAFAAQLIRSGELEEAKKVVDEMTQSENIMLQRKGLKLKTTLTEIIKRVRDSSSFDKKILQDIEKTSV